MNCVVFGSNGFIGSHLYNRLNELGHKVSRGDRQGNIPIGTDWVFDLASYGNIYGQEDKDKIYKTIVERFKNILFQSGDCRAVVATSSSSVDRLPLTDYARAKREVEELAFHSGHPVSAIRPYTVFGFGDNESHLIPRLFSSCVDGTPLQLAPSPTHDYIWVGDLVEMYVKLAESTGPIGGMLAECGSGIPTSNSEVFFIV